MSTDTTTTNVEKNEIKKENLPNCFISSPFEGVYGRFNMYENERDGKTYKNFSLQIFNGKKFKTKKDVPYTSMLMSISGAKKLHEELDKAIKVFEANMPLQQFIKDE